jgi:thiamine pyrophosphokinase
MKDLDLTRLIYKKPMLINMNYSDRYNLIETLKADSSFLCQRNIMDYSLLLIIEEKPHQSIKESLQSIGRKWAKEMLNFEGIKANNSTL